MNTTESRARPAAFHSLGQIDKHGHDHRLKLHAPGRDRGNPQRRRPSLEASGFHSRGVRGASYLEGSRKSELDWVDAFRREFGDIDPDGPMVAELRGDHHLPPVAGRSSMAAAIAPSNCSSEAGLVIQTWTPSESADACAC